MHFYLYVPGKVTAGRRQFGPPSRAPGGAWIGDVDGLILKKNTRRDTCPSLVDIYIMRALFIPPNLIDYSKDRHYNIKVTTKSYSSLLKIHTKPNTTPLAIGTYHKNGKYPFKRNGTEWNLFSFRIVQKQNITNSWTVCGNSVQLKNWFGRILGLIQTGSNFIIEN